MTDDDRPTRPLSAHEIGQPLDTLSMQDFEERLVLLRTEIARLEAARERKRAALEAAGSVFARR